MADETTPTDGGEGEAGDRPTWTPSPHVPPQWTSTPTAWGSGPGGPGGPPAWAGSGPSGPPTWAGSGPSGPPQGPVGPWPSGPGGSGLPPKPRRRGRRILVVGIVLVVVAALVGGGLFAWDRLRDDSPYPDEWDPRIEPIAEWVADERDLEFEHPVEVILLTEEEYRRNAASDPAAESEEDLQEAEDFVSLLRALGLASGEIDLEAATEDLLGEGSLAYYSYEEEKVYVRGDELTPSVRVTLAHELTHVLQDQHFDLSRMADPDFDRSEGLRAMAEGDAGRIEDAYADAELTDEEQDEHEQQSSEDSEGAEAGLEEVPPALVALFSAPYTLGDGFLTDLGGDNAEIDEVLRDPPSEQELLDPTSRGTDRAEPVAVPAIDPPEGAEEVDSDEFGPTGWFLLLAARSTPAEALAVVDGWGGDAYVAYREDDVVCADLVVEGDDPATTDAFQMALTAWAGQDPTGQAEVSVEDGGVRLHSCDPGADAEAIGEISADMVAIPLFRTQIETMLEQTGLDPAQARCASTRLLAEFTLEELTTTEASPEMMQDIQQRAADAVAACR